MYTLIPESDAIARLLAAVTKRRPIARTSQEPARGLFKNRGHGRKLVILYRVPRLGPQVCYHAREVEPSHDWDQVCHTEMMVYRQSKSRAALISSG